MKIAEVYSQAKIDELEAIKEFCYRSEMIYLEKPNESRTADEVDWFNRALADVMMYCNKRIEKLEDNLDNIKKDPNAFV